MVVETFVIVHLVLHCMLVQISQVLLHSHTKAIDNAILFSWLRITLWKDLFSGALKLINLLWCSVWPLSCSPELVSEEPFIVRLLFEPSGRPDSQEDYYLKAKENLCVVCGKADSYIRFVFDHCVLFVHAYIWLNINTMSIHMLPTAIPFFSVDLLPSLC